MQNQYGEHVIKINFPYNLDTLNNIRSLAGRKWHKEKDIGLLFLQNH